MAEHNVLIVTFSDRSKAFEAFSVLKGAADSTRLVLRGAHLVARDEHGRLTVPESEQADVDTGVWGGGLVGMLIGVLGGPIGMLFGWTGGMLLGSAFDVRRADRVTSVLGKMSDTIPPGGTAIIAEVEEFAHEVVDGEMAKLGGSVLRRPADEVLAEMEAAEEAYREAEKEADRRAREQRKAERKENFEERKAALKEKLGIG